MRKQLFFLVFIFAFIQCQKAPDLHPVAQTRIMMDTVVQIVLYDKEKSEAQLQEIINQAFDRIAEIDSLTNNYSDSSQISFVNRNAATEKVIVDTSLMKILTVGQKISNSSNGKFDITIGAIKRLWRFASEHPRVPDSLEIQKQLNFVNYNLVQILDNAVKFKKSGVNIDLGGIAKGYAIDEAMRIILKAGVKDAMVDAGGDLAISSGALTRGKRRVFIQHPRKQGQFIGYFRLDSGCVATSGDYERFFYQDSVRYHHLLDPDTGYPARKCVSVTVVTQKAIVADALATAIFVLGPKQGMVFVNELPNTEAIIVFQDKNKLNYVATEGLQTKIHFSKNWEYY